MAPSEGALTYDEMEKGSLAVFSSVIFRALGLLDAEIGESDLLMSVTPLRLISVGGSMAVRVCFNRESSYDIDYMLDPNVAGAHDYREEFEAAISQVAEARGYMPDWLNQQVEMFVSKERRMHLFLESVQQGITIYEGKNLIIYAGTLSWALERKIRRIAHARDRRKNKHVDVSDAAAIVRLIRRHGEPPISFSYLRQLNLNGGDAPPTDEAIQEVARYYDEVYGEVGIADLV